MLVYTTAGYTAIIQNKKCFINHMGFLSLSKSIRATMYIFPSFQQAGFSEGLLASNKQKCLQYSAKHPGSISHECWITLGVPQACLFTCELCSFIYDSNMVKRWYVSSIVDSFHRHGSSMLIEGTR